jgi:hypothetical protein
MEDVCVCALLYGGDHHCENLARRLLNDEFIALGQYADIRIGLNAVGAETRKLVSGVVEKFPNTVVIDCPENINKHPMMRRLFDARPIGAPLTMWFDDDSCLVPGTNVHEWLARVQKQLGTYALIGSVYHQGYLGGQVDWIKAQDWYSGLEPARCLQFVAGGWWCARTDALRRLNWPSAGIKNRGGDMMLSEAMRQHHLLIGHFRDNLWISANEFGVEAKSPRRAASELPVGVDYVPA